MNIDDLKVFFFLLSLVIQFAGVFLIKKENFSKKKFLISSIMITALLVFILIFKVHHLLRSEINLPNTATYLLILLPFILHLLRFKEEILNNNFIVLLFSLISIFFALVLDLITDARIIQFASSDYVEELFRMAGSILWFIYYQIYVIKNTSIYGTN